MFCGKVVAMVWPISEKVFLWPKWINGMQTEWCESGDKAREGNPKVSGPCG